MVLSHATKNTQYNIAVVNGTDMLSKPFGVIASTSIAINAINGRTNNFAIVISTLK